MKKAIIIIFFAAILILQTPQTQPAETQPVNLGASGDTREAYDCSRCAAGTEKCTSPSSDYTVTVNGVIEERHDNAQCTLDWGSATFDFSLVSMAALNNNIEKVSDEALKNNIHRISDLAGLASQEAKDKLSKTFREKYGVDFGVTDATGKVTINEEGVLSTNGISISMPELKNIDGLNGIELYTIASASGDVQNGVRYKYGSNSQVFDVVGTFRSLSADSNGNLVVDGFKAKFSEKSGRIGINNGYVTTTNAYVAADKDEIYGAAAFFMNRDGTIDKVRPVTLNGERTWACFDGREKCSHNNPEWDLILGDAQGRYDFDDSKTSATKVCLHCPKERLDELESEIEQGSIQGYAFWEKKQDSNGDFSDALEMRGKLLSTFNNNFIEGNDINIKYSVISDGKYTDMDFRFLADSGQRQDQKLGRVIAHGKSLELYKDDDGTVHINEHNYAGETTMPLHSNAFIKNAVFNENDISASTLHSYGGSQIKSIRDNVYGADYNDLDPKVIAYLKQKNPDADEKTIREEYLKVAIGTDYAFDSTGKKAKSYEEAYSYGNKIYSLANKEEDEMRAGVPERGEKTIIRQETFITTPDGINVGVENTYEIGANAMITRANPNYEEYLNMKFERDAWQRHSSDGEFQSLGREDQKKVIDAELTYMRPLILSKAKLNEVRNRIEEIQEKKGAEGGIKEAGMLVYENWLYKDDLASYWQRMKQLEKEEKGNQEVIQMARQGKTLSEIRNEYADSENIQMAFKQPELKFLYNQDAIQSAIANGKTAVEIDGEHYDISSEDRIRELVIGNYMSTAQAHEGLKNWAEANNYYLAMLKLTMGDDDYKTLEEAIKAHPDLVYFKTYFLSSSEFTEGTLLYAYPDEVKELIRTGQVNEKLLEAYINNKERMNSNSVDVRGVAELILPKDYWQVALNLLPEARGTFIVAKAATGTVVRQATKIMLKESAHLAAVAITGFGPKGGAEGAERLLALKSREGMASALEKIEIEGTWKGLVNPPTLERPRLDLPAAALTGCDVCAGSIPTLEDAENMARRIADGTATEKEISDYARSLAAAYNEGLIGDAGIDAQARLIEDAKIRGGYAATGGTETAKTVPEEIRKAADDYASGKADVSEFERAQQQLMESFVAGDIDQSQFGELKAALEDAQMRRIELEDSARGIAKGASHAEKEGYLAAEARDEIVEQFEKQSGEIGETAAARQTVTDYGDELVEEINEKFDDFQKEASVTFKSEEMLDEATLKEDYIDRLLGDHGLTSGKITPVSDLERDRLAETILALKEDGFKDDEIQYLVELVLFQSREGAATSLANHGISHLADDYLSLRKLMEEAGFSPTPDQRKAIAQGAILHDIGYTSDVMNWGKGNVHGLSFTKAHPELGREFITAPATAAKLKAMYDNPETAGEMLKIVDSMAGEHAVVSRDFLDAANCLPKCSPEQEKDMIVRMFGLVDDAGVGKDTTLMQDADVWGELLEMKGDPPKATFNEEGMQRLKVQYGCGEIPKPPSCVALDTMSAGTFSFNGPRLAVSPKSEIKIVARDGKRVAVVEIEYSQEAIGLMYDVGIARKPYYTASDFPCDAPCEDNMMRALRGEDPYGNGQVRLGINSAGVELWAKNFHIGCEETLLGRDVCRTLMRK